MRQLLHKDSRVCASVCVCACVYCVRRVCACGVCMCEYVYACVYGMSVCMRCVNVSVCMFLGAHEYVSV